MKILLGVDDAEAASESLRTIVEQCRAEQTEVMVLHMLQPASAAPPQMGFGYAPELIEEKTAVEPMMERIAGQLRGAGFDARIRIEVGDVRDGILGCAADWKADLIVMGSHGHNGLQRLLLGSVSDYVARHAKCSVELVRRSQDH